MATLSAGACLTFFIWIFSLTAKAVDVFGVNTTAVMLTAQLSGENAILQCRGPRGAEILLLTWRRSDLMSEYVFFYREKNHSYEDYQHSSFRGRVELRDPEMKDGDLSVVLKNVSVNDTGTYLCRVAVNATDSETATDFWQTTNLTVTDSGQTPGHTGCPGLIVGLSVFGGLFLGGVVVVVGLMIFRKCKERPYQRPNDEEAQYEYK